MIKGLQTDQPGLPRAGIIRLGYRKAVLDNNGQPKLDKYGKPITRPVEADHFVLTDAPGVAEAIGEDKPKSLKIYFPFDDINLVFPAFMTLFSASSMICKGDGERIIYAIDPTTGVQVIRDGIALKDSKDFKKGEFMPCHKDRNLYPKCAGCKANGILVVLLRDIPRLAYYQIATGSWNNIPELTKQFNTHLENVKKITGQRRLTGVPFILTRIQQEKSAPKKDKDGNPIGRMRQKHYFLQLEIDPDWVMKLFAAQRRLADPMIRFSLPQPELVPIQVENTLPTDAPFMEPPQWEAPLVNEPEDAVIIDEAAEEVIAKPSDNGGSKPYRFPSQAAEKFYNEVQTATNNYYTGPFHLIQILGGQWFNFGNKTLWDEKLDFATSHARKARESEQPGLVGVETAVEMKAAYSED